VDWQEVRQGLYVVEIGDHGAALTAVREDREDDSFIYSVSDGDEWRTCKYSDVPVMARNIRVSAGWDSRRFILYGHRRNDAGREESVLVHINLDDEFSGPCTDANSDFESWSPKDEHGQCVMGQSSIIKRRKVGKTCYLAEEHIHEIVSQPCPCSLDDYECDFCFTRPWLNATCTLECIVPDLPDPGALCQAHSSTNPRFYPTTKGYRLVGGTKCNPALPGSVKPEGRIPCGALIREPGPHPGITDSSAAGVVIVIAIALVLLLAGLGTVLYLWRYNDSFYNTISYTTGIDNCFGRGTSAAASEIYAQALGGSLVDDKDDDDGDFKPGSALGVAVDKDKDLQQVKLNLDSDED